MKKVLAMLMAALMVAAMFTGCSSSKPATETTAAAAAATAGTVKIGMSGPLTGGASAYGLAVKAGMEVAVEEINAKGGLQIEFNAQDDEADGEKAVSAYNVLKDWGMQVMAGQVTTGSALAVAPESTADNMFNLTPSASAESLALSGANIFQMCFTDPNQGASAAELVSTKALGTKDYYRVRTGIGRPPGRMDTADFVLKPFSSTEVKDLPFLISNAADATMMLVKEGLLATQQRYHGAGS